MNEKRNENGGKRQTVLNFTVDIVSFAVLAFLITTGIVMKHILPPGTGGKLSVWGFDRHQWGELHFWLAAVFFAFMTYHIWLHWKWIVAVVTGKRPFGAGPLAYSVFAVIVSLSAVAPVLSPVEQVSGGYRGEFRQEKPAETSEPPAVHDTDEIDGRRGKREGNKAIRGSMTLREVEAATGVPSYHIIRELNLLGTVTPDDSLGHLRKSYGFEMKDVRNIVEKYRAEEK